MDHPLPRYYRGHGLLLMAKLLYIYLRESGAEGSPHAGNGDVLNTLVTSAMDDLTEAARLLD